MSLITLSLRSKLLQMMVQMFVHPHRPLLRRQSAKETMWVRGATPSPCRGKPVDHSAQPLALRCEVTLVVNNKPRHRRRIPAHRFVFPKRLRLIIAPRIRPINIRGGSLSPTANSKPAVQCAIACATFILPHSRLLSGLRCLSRSFTSSTVVASNRFFTLNPFSQSTLTSIEMPFHYKNGRQHL